MLWSEGNCGMGAQPGEPCVDCVGTCQAGRCVGGTGKCNPDNCDGCCEGDNCVDGVQLVACGTGGEPCQMCTPPKMCKQGKCQ